MQDIIKKWQAKTASVAIIGLGYVGLPLALAFAKAGVKTIGIDKDESKIISLKQGKSYLHHIAGKDVVHDNFSFTDDFGVVEKVDGIIICVPTPLQENNEPDLSFIHDSLDGLMPYLQKGQVLALESTTYPGTTDEEISSRLKDKGFEVGKDFYLVYSPEREDPGNKDFSTSTIPKILGGCTTACGEVGMAMYNVAIAKMVKVKDAKTAEMAKLLENIYRSVNIGLVNEMKQISDAMGIDIFDVIRAADTKPFGFKAFYPGPGVGGHCIAVDPYYLTWKARHYGVETRFIELAGEINESMPEYVVNILSGTLQDLKKPLKGSKIFILGVSYKKNIGDLREAPALEVIHLLQEAGAEVIYSDPYIAKLGQFGLVHTDCDKGEVESADAVLIISDHDDFDYDMVKQYAKLIIDSRGRFATDKNIIRA